MYVQDLLFKIISEMLKNNCGDFCQIYVIHPNGTSISVENVDVYYDDETGELVIELNPEEEE